MGSLYDVEVNETLIYIVRLLGAAFVEIGALTWFARNADDSVARRAIIMALLIGNAIGFVVALIGQLNNVIGTLGWSSVAIYLLFVIGYGYFQFIKMEP